MRVTLFTEYNPSMDNAEGKANYPEGMNECLRSFLAEHHEVKFFVYGDSDNPDGSNLTEEVLKETDVLVLWGHWYHGRVDDKVSDLIVEYVNRGMGLMVLHSGHMSKPFRKIIGGGGQLSWRECGENERVWVVNPAHPIARGVGQYIDLEHEEMYGEPFNVPAPDELVFISWFKGGEVCRSGLVYNRGYGKVFYFRPGHETLPTYKNEKIRTVLLNAIEYIAPKMPVLSTAIPCPEVKTPLEKI